MDKRLLSFIFAYFLILISLYLIPSGLENEWYSFYSYLDLHKAIPYIDVREGYPPLGFLIYMPLYYAFKTNKMAFFYGFRILNGGLLTATVASLYLTLEKLFTRREALRLTLHYAVLPSVIVANIYSNDVVALLPASLAIFSMLRKRSLACGVFIGLATLGKGFPLLLIFPAFIAFKGRVDRLKLFASTALILTLGSLPFLIVSPLTYISTFTHHESRGPWETIWALLEGYYSHGGLLHPYFDKFFYHSNLLELYQSPFDHAFYEWKFRLLPLFLTIGQIAMIVLSACIRVRDERKLVSLCGLVYVGYMLFFKGYSTQFSVSTQFYVLLVMLDTPLAFLFPLEMSHILQMMSWMGLPGTNFELLREGHFTFLVSSIILRTVVFVLLMSKTLIRSELDFFIIIKIFRGIISNLNLFRNRWLIISASIGLLAGLIAFSSVYDYVRGGEMLRFYKGEIKVNTDEWKSIELHEINTGDQVLIRIYTHTWIEAEVVSTSGINTLERGIRNPYNLKGSFDEQLFFFKANDGSKELRVKMKHPRVPFRITDGFEGDLQANITMSNSKIILRLRDIGVDGTKSLFRMAYPIKARVDDKFNLAFNYKILEGRPYKVFMDVFDDTDEWLYSMEAENRSILDEGTIILSGNSKLHEDEISLVAFVVVINDGDFVEISFDKLDINGNKINLFAETEEEISYEVLIEKDFRPSDLYKISLVIMVVSNIITISLLARRLKSRVC